MILLQLFAIFFEIGLFTFGGGYAMIPLFRTELVARGLIAEEALIDFIAVSESTPGPFAVNVATFVGNANAGIPGAIAATVGVVLPSFLILLLIARFSAKILESSWFRSAFVGLKPAVAGLVLAVAVTLGAERVFPSLDVNALDFDFGIFDLRALAILTIVFVLSRTVRKLSPIILLGIAALLGIVFYGFL
jgi:chromate transporter